MHIHSGYKKYSHILIFSRIAVFSYHVLRFILAVSNFRSNFYSFFIATPYTNQLNAIFTIYFPLYLERW